MRQPLSREGAGQETGVGYRDVEKNKLVYDRCRPIMARYENCGICMKVYPVQKFGMKDVMEHYVATGEVLAKGTDKLEGYTLNGKGHFGPGELPHFERETFDFPHGRSEDWLFEQFKHKLEHGGVPPPDQLEDFAEQVKEALHNGKHGAGE